MATKFCRKNISSYVEGKYILHVLRFGALLYDEEKNNVFWVHQKFTDSRKIKSHDFFLVKSLVLYLILLEIRIFFTKSNNGPSRCGAKKNLCMLVIVSK